MSRSSSYRSCLFYQSPLSHPDAKGKQLQKDSPVALTALQSTKALRPKLFTPRYTWMWRGTFVCLFHSLCRKRFRSRELGHRSNYAKVQDRPATIPEGSVADRAISVRHKIPGLPVLKELPKVLSSKHCDIPGGIGSWSVPKYKHTPPAIVDVERYFFARSYRLKGGTIRAANHRDGSGL